MTRLNATRLPQYVQRVGDLVYAPPYDLDDTDLTALVLDVERGAVQPIIDNELNEPWRRAFERRGYYHDIRVEGDWVLLLFADTRRAKPQRTPTLANVNGGVSECAVAAQQYELLMMVPIVDYDRRATRATPAARAEAASPTSLWYLPFVFNDLPPAIVEGRELYGYPKQYATFSTEPRLPRRRPGRPRPRLFGETARGGGRRVPWQRLTMSAYFATPAEDEWRLGLVPFVVVEPRQGPAKPRAASMSRTPDFELVVARPPAHRNFTSPQHLAAGGGDDGEPWHLAEARQRLDGATAEYLFLREFLDPCNPDKASYQSIVRSEIVPAPDSDLTFVPELDTSYVVTFPDLDQMQNPIARVLGATGPIAASALHAHGDLQVNKPTIEWDRS